MTDVQEKPTLTFDGNNYAIEDLSDQAKYFVDQLQDLHQQGVAARARVDQIEVARRGFEGLLREELGKEPAETAEEVVAEPVATS